MENITQVNLGLGLVDVKAHPISECHPSLEFAPLTKAYERGTDEENGHKVLLQFLTRESVDKVIRLLQVVRDRGDFNCPIMVF